MTVLLFPPDFPDCILQTTQGVLVKRSPMLPDGSRIYVIYDNSQGVLRRQEGSFLSFLNWFERYVGRQLEIYTIRDGIMDLVEDGPNDLFTGVAA